MTVLAAGSAIGDQRAREVNKREIPVGSDLPANANPTKVVMPAVRALDDPTSSATAMFALALALADSREQVRRHGVLPDVTPT